MRVAVVWLLVLVLGAMALSPAVAFATTPNLTKGPDDSVAGLPLAKLKKMLERHHAAHAKGSGAGSKIAGGFTIKTATGSTPGTTTTSTSGTSTPGTTAPSISTSTAQRSPAEIEAQIKALEQGGGTGASHPVAKHSSSKLSGTGILLIVLAGAALLAALLWAAFSFAVLEPHWLLSLRHSLAEAGYRASAVWAEFADWVRLGH